MTTVIRGFKEAIEQALQVLENINSKDYLEVARPILEYSIGSHFRHNLDVFIAVKTGYETGIIDYDVRRRGHAVEKDINLAIKEHNLLKAWILALDEKELDIEVTVQSEALLSKKESVKLTSSLKRELLFASSHAVHHYAMISTALKFKGVKVNDNFGYAPATASFLRDE